MEDNVNKQPCQDSDNRRSETGVRPYVGTSPSALRRSGRLRGRVELFAVCLSTFISICRSLPSQRCEPNCCRRQTNNRVKRENQHKTLPHSALNALSLQKLKPRIKTFSAQQRATSNDTNTPAMTETRIKKQTALLVHIASALFLFAIVVSSSGGGGGTARACLQGLRLRPAQIQRLVCVAAILNSGHDTELGQLVVKQFLRGKGRVRTRRQRNGS